MLFGGTGSGKSSGPGRFLALKYLAAQWGGLVLTVKPDEKETWQSYCKMTGREKDLIILEPGGKESFNFLEYLSTVSSDARSVTENIVDVFSTVINAGALQEGGSNTDPFWQNALEMLIFNVIDLSKLAYGKVSIPLMYDIVQAIPKGNVHPQPEGSELKAFQKAFEAARTNVTAKIETWVESWTLEQQSRLKDEALFEAELLQTVPDARLLKMLDSFFFDTFIPLSDKTRGIIDFSFSGLLFRLLREPIYSLFCKHPPTFTPEDSLRGKIILLNLPAKIFHRVGIDVQILFKFLWQKAMEARNVRENGKPVFIFVDEAHLMIHPTDQEVQTTARSSRIATVYITQNISNLFAAMGGPKSESRVKSFLGTLASKWFMANSDQDTNKYASELIGEAYFEDRSESTTVSANISQTSGRSLKLQRIVRPEQFQSLRTGGPENDLRVEAYLHRQGGWLIYGKNHIKMAFNQDYQP